VYSGVKLAQSGGGILRQIDGVIFACEKQFQAFTDIRFVVNNEDPAPLGRANTIGGQNLIRKSHYCGCSRQVLYAVNASRRDATACGERTKIPGNSRRKRVPWSSMLSTSIMPLCSCTMP